MDFCNITSLYFHANLNSILYIAGAHQQQDIRAVEILPLLQEKIAIVSGGLLFLVLQQECMHITKVSFIFF